jgi:hypothetical protein
MIRALLRRIPVTAAGTRSSYMSTSLYASVIARGRGRQTISQPLKQTTMRPPSVQYLAKMMRSRVLYKYLALGMGVASMGYYGYSKYW